MSRLKSKPKSDYCIQTVSNALRMLEAFRSDDSLGVSELARRLCLHKNNVFRLLATLEEGGYIEQCSDTERYRLGTSCLELGHSFARSHTLLRRARPILEELVRKVGETSHLGVLRDDSVVHLDGAAPEQLVLSALRVGQRVPLHCTAVGKVLLAYCADDVREAILLGIAEAGTVQHTQATRLDPAKLAEHLGGVAVQGYAVDLEEFELGLRCASAPVFDSSGTCIGALSVSGPAFRLSEDALHGDVGRSVMAAASQLSQELGAVS